MRKINWEKVAQWSLLVFTLALFGYLILLNILNLP